MANQYNSKVVLTDGSVIMDLTADTVDAAHLLAPYTAHGADGAPIVGACTYDSDTSADTATVGEVLSGETFHARGTAYTGTMPNNGSVSGTISTKDGTYTVPQGFHDGAGSVGIAQVEKNKIIASNIKSGVQILGVTGSYSGEAVDVQSKTFTPTLTGATVLPDSGYDYLSQVTVNPIPIAYADNAAGGVTVTIG